MEEKKQVDVANANVVSRDDYADTLRMIIAKGFCPFCEENLDWYHRRPLLYKSTHWLVTRNSWPYKGTQFHVLFIARKHIERIEEMSATMLLDLQDLYKKLTEKEGIRGSTLMIRSGDTKITGATVNHLHAHVVVGGPRTEHSKPIKALVGFEK